MSDMSITSGRFYHGHATNGRNPVDHDLGITRSRNPPDQ